MYSVMGKIIGMYIQLCIWWYSHNEIHLLCCRLKYVWYDTLPIHIYQSKSIPEDFIIHQQCYYNPQSCLHYFL